MNARASRRFVAYYRVSTDRQGRSGLGLEAQQKAVTDYLNGGAWELIGEFIEVESSKRSDRPELARALDACRKHKARLVIAKLDRLSRNLACVATLIEFCVQFCGGRQPHANKLTIHIPPCRRAGAHACGPYDACGATWSLGGTRTRSDSWGARKRRPHGIHASLGQTHPRESQTIAKWPSRVRPNDRTSWKSGQAVI
jgi:hypothetical protein